MESSHPGVTGLVPDISINEGNDMNNLASRQLVPGPGSRILIAGGSGGIGRELVRACVELDFRVAVLDISESLQAHPLEDGVTYLPFDGREPQSIEEAVGKVSGMWDGLEHFSFLSGFPIIPKVELKDTPLSKWNELIAVNLTSAYLLATHVMPLLKQGTSPTMVTVVSSLAYQAAPGMGAYLTSKGGLVSLTKALAVENAPLVRVNAVAPGAVDTEFLSGGTGRSDDKNARAWFDEQSESYRALIPLGRVAEPIDVVGPILFLAGQGSRYMTGQVLHLNGGRLTP